MITSAVAPVTLNVPVIVLGPLRTTEKWPDPPLHGFPTNEPGDIALTLPLTVEPLMRRPPPGDTLILPLMVWFWILHHDPDGTVTLALIVEPASVPGVPVHVTDEPKASLETSAAPVSMSRPTARPATIFFPMTPSPSWVIEAAGVFHGCRRRQRVQASWALTNPPDGRGKRPRGLPTGVARGLNN